MLLHVSQNQFIDGDLRFLDLGRGHGAVICRKLNQQPFVLRSAFLGFVKAWLQRRTALTVDVVINDDCFAGFCVKSVRRICLATCHRCNAQKGGQVRNTAKSRLFQVFKLHFRPSEGKRKVLSANDLYQWSRRGSNPQPLECHSSALPIAPRPHGNFHPTACMGKRQSVSTHSLAKKPSDVRIVQ